MIAPRRALNHREDRSLADLSPEEAEMKLMLIFFIVVVASWVPFHDPRQTALHLQLSQCKKIVETSWFQSTTQRINLFPLNADKKLGIFKVCNMNCFR